MQSETWKSTSQWRIYPSAVPEYPDNAIASGTECGEAGKAAAEAAVRELLLNTPEPDATGQTIDAAFQAAFTEGKLIRRRVGFGPSESVSLHNGQLVFTSSIGDYDATPFRIFPHGVASDWEIWSWDQWERKQAATK